MMLAKRLSAAIAIFTLAAASLTACADTGPEFPNSLGSNDVSSDLRGFYEQKVDWQKCEQQPDTGEVIYCSVIEVPKNWDDVAAGKFSLAAAFLPAKKTAIGSVVFNPGGPGSAATDWLLSAPSGLGTAKLRENYNLVAIDPRGVGASDPAIECLADNELTELIYSGQTFPIASAEDREETQAGMRKFFDGCRVNLGDDLGMFNTEFTARDLDIVRSVLGETKLNYLGFSYGTLLGATYADLYPSNVGRMVLDGAINPLLTQEVQTLAQIKGFELALSNYIAACLENADCPFKGSLRDAQIQLEKLFAEIEQNPLRTDSKRRLEIWAAVTGVIMPLYGETWWPTLTEALNQAFSGDGTGLLELADIYNDYDPNEAYYFSNLIEANIVINCLDARASAAPSDMDQQNKRILKASPVFGRYSLDGGLACAGLDIPVRAHEGDYRATGSPSILVIGTTGDPATPYQQAVDLAGSVLANGRLITYQGVGHTAYGSGSSCVDNAVDDYFIKNTVPTEDLTCQK